MYGRPSFGKFIAQQASGVRGASTPVCRLDQQETQRIRNTVAEVSPSPPINPAKGIVVVMPFAQLLRREGISAEAKETETLSISKLFALELKDVALICLCYLEHATPAQLHYASRRLRRKAPGVSILVGIFNETGQTPDSDPQQLPEGVEFLQGPLSAGVKRVSEILSRPRAYLKQISLRWRRPGKKGAAPILHRERSDFGRPPIGCYSIGGDDLTLKYERVAKIMKVATINPSITRIVRCSALGIVVRGPFIARRVGTGCGAHETANNAFYFDTRRDEAAAIANARKALTIPAVLISPSGHSDHRCLSPILRVKRTLRRNLL
jgi:hypothetical protein